MIIYSPTLIVFFIGLAVSICVVSLILRCLGFKSYAKSFGIGHLLFIIVVFCLYYFGTRDAQNQLFWIFPDIVDLPISLLVNILAPDNMGIYILLLATLGSCQYAAIGWCIDYKLSKDRKTLLPKRRFKILGICALIGLAYWTYTKVSYLMLDKCEQAEARLKNANIEVNEKNRSLRDAAKSCFDLEKYDKSKKYADELSKLANENKSDWNIYGTAFYDSHIVLGRLDLLGGKPEQAIYHLLEAAKTPGHATLATFGPDMSLAKDLLEKGYKEPVIEFLIECKKFWESGEKEGKIDKWVKEIKEGKMPDFKRF
jgi:tetratricopeptide (TPR) repeat protein